MNRRLILVRHASTVPLESGNIKYRDYNETLSGKGRQQAEALAARLSGIDATIWSSPQPRALATATAIARGRRVLTQVALEDWRDEETDKQMFKRVTRFTDALEGTHIIVAHGTPIVMILAHQVSGSYYYQTQWGLVPGGISVIQGGVLIAVNDTTHLGYKPETAVYDTHTWCYV